VAILGVAAGRDTFAGPLETIGEYMKSTYQPPRVESLGAVADLTLGQTSGNFLDATFPTGTPFSDLTFS
jgi:hypothetical protein